MEVSSMMSISGVMKGVIVVLVATILVASVLIPTIQGIEFTGTNAAMYTTLLGVVGTLSILIPVLVIVKMLGSGRD